MQAKWKTDASKDEKTDVSKVEGGFANHIIILGGEAVEEVREAICAAADAESHEDIIKQKLVTADAANKTVAKEIGKNPDDLAAGETTGEAIHKEVCVSVDEANTQKVGMSGRARGCAEQRRLVFHVLSSCLTPTRLLSSVLVFCARRRSGRRT